MGIRYKIVPGFPAYRVGTDGSVWSKRRDGRPRLGRGPDYWKANSWRELKTGIEPGRFNYRYVSLVSEAGSKRFRLHVLVLFVFRGPRPPGCVSRHRNDDRSNNTLKNLAYGTFADNVRDAIRNGKTKFGEDHGSSKLRARDVTRILRRLNRGESASSIAKDYPVGYSQIRRIARGQDWADHPGRNRFVSDHRYSDQRRRRHDSNRVA